MSTTESRRERRYLRELFGREKCSVSLIVVVVIQVYIFSKFIKLGEGPWHTARPLKQPYGEVQVVRNKGLLLTTSKKLRPSARSQVSKVSKKQIL